MAVIWLCAGMGAILTNHGADAGATYTTSAATAETTTAHWYPTTTTTSVAPVERELGWAVEDPQCPGESNPGDVGSGGYETAFTCTPESGNGVGLQFNLRLTEVSVVTRVGAIPAGD